MVLGKKWLFSIGNWAEIWPLEKDRKSPETGILQGDALSALLFFSLLTCVSYLCCLFLNFSWNHSSLSPLMKESLFLEKKNICRLYLMYVSETYLEREQQNFLLLVCG